MRKLERHQDTTRIVEGDFVLIIPTWYAVDEVMGEGDFAVSGDDHEGDQVVTAEQIDLIEHWEES